MIYSLVSVLLFCFLFASYSSLVYSDHGDSNYCQADFPDLSTYSPPASSTAVLKKVILAHRHGARTPYSLLPYYKHPGNDATFNLCSMHAIQSFDAFPTAGPSAVDRLVSKHPTIDSSLSPFAKRMYQGNCMTGQLTDKGIQQLYRLGIQLRTIYVDKYQFIPSSIDALNSSAASPLYVRSTDVWRTLQSVQSLLSGLYPPEYGVNRDNQIPITVLPEEIETLYANPTACPAIVGVEAKVSSSGAWKKHLSDNADLLKRLNNACSTTGNADFSTTFTALFDQIFTRYCHGVPLPCSDDKSQCISDADRIQLGKMGDLEYQMQFALDEPSRVAMARLGISQFFVQLRDIFSSDTSALFNIVSCHDTTIYPIIAALNFTDARSPPYASNILFELWSDNGNQFIRVLHNGHLLSLPFCGLSTECPMNTFISYLNNTIIPNDLLAECDTTDDERPVMRTYGFRPHWRIPSYQF